MKSYFSLLLLLASSVFVFPASFTSVQSGNFSVGSTWGGTAPSSAGDTWTIATGHSVIYDTDNSAGAGWGASVVTGNLVMTNLGTQVSLKMQGNLSGLGNWRIGSVSNPISYVSTNLAGVVIEFKGAAQCTMAGTNNLGWYGDSSHVFTTYLSAACASGATSITVTNVPANITTNDVICIGDVGVAGQANSEYYVIASVTGTNLTFLQTPLGTATNNYPGVTFRSSTSSTRAIGTFVSFCSQPIVVKETARRSVSLCNASQTNTVTGVLIQNTGRGLATACSTWTAYLNTINNGSSGSLANNNCASWKAYLNTINNCTTGGFAQNSCSNWIAYSNTVNNSSFGGLASNNCSTWTAYLNTVNNFAVGGLAQTGCGFWTVYSNTVSSSSNGGLGYNNCLSWVAYSNTINNFFAGGLGFTGCNSWIAYLNTINGCTNGGLANSTCNSWAAYLNTVNNCANGGLGFNLCNSWTACSNTVNNCTGGGLGNISCNSWTAYSNIVSNSAPLFVSCSSVIAAGNTIGYTSDTHSGSIYGFDPLSLDLSWVVPWGVTYETNELGINLIHHAVTTVGTNNYVPAWFPVSVRPGGSRAITVFAYQTNGVSYYAGVVPVAGSPASPSQLTLVSPTTSSGGWTNILLTLNNAGPFPISGRVWVCATATTNNSVGYSYIQESSDAIGLKQ